MRKEITRKKPQMRAFAPVESAPAELAGPEWRFVELPTGHWPMFSRPEDLAELLLDLPSEKSVQNYARAT